MIRLIDTLTNILAAHLELLALRIQDTKTEHYVQGFADGRHEPEHLIEWRTNE